MGGHLGTKKCLAKIIQRFFYPNLKDEVIKFIKCCDAAQRNIITQPARKDELKLLTKKTNKKYRKTKFQVAVTSEQPVRRGERNRRKPDIYQA